MLEGIAQVGRVTTAGNSKEMRFFLVLWEKGPDARRKPESVLLVEKRTCLGWGYPMAWLVDKMGSAPHPWKGGARTQKKTSSTERDKHCASTKRAGPGPKGPVWQLVRSTCLGGETAFRKGCITCGPA